MLVIQGAERRITDNAPYRKRAAERISLSWLRRVAALASAAVSSLRSSSGVAVVGVDDVRVLHVEVVVAGFDVLRGDAPGDFAFLAFIPPRDLGGEFLEANGAGFVVGFLRGGDAVLVEPGFLGRPALGEEEEIGADAGVGAEDAVGEADDGVEVALGEEFFLDAGLDAFAEERAVGEDDGGAPAGSQQPHDERQEKIGGLAGLELLREIALNTVLLAPAEGWIGEDDVHPVGLDIADVGPGEGVVVADEGGIVDAVEQHVGDAEHVRKLLLFGCAQALLHLLLVVRAFHIALAYMTEGASKEDAGAARRVEENLARLITN